MKPVGMSATQNQSKGQNWKGRGSKVGATGTVSTSTLVPTASKNDKSTNPITRPKAKNALIQLLKTIRESLLSDSETECEDNSMSDGGETEIDEDDIHVTHSDIEEQ